MDTTKWVIGLPDPSFWNDPVPPTQDGLPELRFREGAVYVMDTQRLFNASGLPEAQRQVGLENALKTLEIPYRYLHNAGNDACCKRLLHRTTLPRHTFLLIPEPFNIRHTCSLRSPRRIRQNQRRAHRPRQA